MQACGGAVGGEAEEERFFADWQEAMNDSLSPLPVDVDAAGDRNGDILDTAAPAGAAVATSSHGSDTALLHALIAPYNQGPKRTLRRRLT